MGAAPDGPPLPEGGDTAPWLMLDLLESQPVGSVTIYNRDSGFQDRLGTHNVIISNTAVEALIREMYGLEKAFADVKDPEDWKQPKGSKIWTSKVRWELRDRFSIRKLLQGGHRVQKAEAEVKKGMEQDALFAKYLGKVSGANAITDSSDGAATTN